CAPAPQSLCVQRRITSPQDHFWHWRFWSLGNCLVLDTAAERWSAGGFVLVKTPKLFVGGSLVAESSFPSLAIRAWVTRRRIRLPARKKSRQPSMVGQEPYTDWRLMMTFGRRWGAQMHPAIIDTNHCTDWQRTGKRHAKFSHKG
ncbi:MAG TPA: hypothetical protein VMP01_13230, partial [Pirellulaceae bacterium]|nr:hypothetical protein [Pirellulaceae bacterium]